MKHTEKTIQLSLFRKYNSHRYKFANVFYFENESDFLTFTQSGMCYEFEVKISRSDFFIDSKKIRSRKYDSKNTNKKYYIKTHGSCFKSNPSWELCESYPELIECKEYQYSSFRSVLDIKINSSTSISIIPNSSLRMPNKFFYVVPENLIYIDEIPDFAGLIYIDDFGNIKKIKEPKFLHKDKVDPIKLFNRIYNVYEEQLSLKLRKI